MAKMGLEERERSGILGERVVVGRDEVRKRSFGIRVLKSEAEEEAIAF